jgi:predicted site-specific integrase-resolvase
MTETHPDNRRIGYARVSTVGQTLDSQLEQLRAAECSNRNIYREKVTGAHNDRRQLLKMLKGLAAGDVVIVTCLEAGETQRSVARSYNVSQSTISRLTP